MKKSLFWMLGALAVSGLFTFSACDEDEAAPCTEDNNPCADTEKPYCHVVNNAPVCSVVKECNSGEQMGSDGRCANIDAKSQLGGSCTTSDDCVSGLHCDGGVCASDDEKSYRFVRIEDMSPAGDYTKPDPGADIDASVLQKTGQAAIYAKTVKDYKRGDGKSSIKDRTMAADPEKALHEPDSFVNYPNGSQCNYYNSDKSAGNDVKNREFTFVSLGGNGGYLVVEMGGKIEAGDTLDVLELGKCTLFNTNDDPQKLSSTKDGAIAEEIKVQIAISSDAGASWQTLSDSNGQKTATKENHGILSFKIAAADLK